MKEAHSETLTFKQDFLPKSEGTYAICLDNTRASFIPKVVQVTDMFFMFVQFGRLMLSH